MVNFWIWCRPLILYIWHKTVKQYTYVPQDKASKVHNKTSYVQQGSLKEKYILILEQISYSTRIIFWPDLSTKLKTRFGFENQFCKPCFTNWVRQYFCFKILFYLVSSYSPFYHLLNQIYTNVKTPKRKLGSLVQRYSFKPSFLYTYISDTTREQGIEGRYNWRGSPNHMIIHALQTGYFIWKRVF